MLWVWTPKHLNVWGCRFRLKGKLCAVVFPHWERKILYSPFTSFIFHLNISRLLFGTSLGACTFFWLLWFDKYSTKCFFWLSQTSNINLARARLGPVVEKHLFTASSTRIHKPDLHFVFFLILQIITAALVLLEQVQSGFLRKKMLTKKGKNYIYCRWQTKTDVGEMSHTATCRLKANPTHRSLFAFRELYLHVHI